MGAEINDPSNINYAASWDLHSPFIDVTYPTTGWAAAIASLKMAYLGWPMIDRRDYVPPQGI